MFGIYLLWVNWALANGGPDIWTDRTLVGEGRPEANVVHTKMVKEDLDIRLPTQTLNRYTVDARYTLQTPTGGESIRFAVPITTGWEEDTRLLAIPDSVALHLDGSPVPCVIEKRETMPLDLGYELGQDAVDAWCVAALELPGKRDDLLLTLQYEAELFHESWSTNVDLFTGVSDRELYYLLWPAASWAGIPKSVNMTVHLGRYTGRAEVVSPPGHRIDDDRVVWNVASTALDELKAVHIKLPAEDFEIHDRLATWNTAEHLERTARVRASSVMQASETTNYAPENMLDGDPTTAWCEGVTAPGETPWIEFEWDPMVSPSDYIEARADTCWGGMFILPGHAQSPETYAGHGAVSRVRMRPCDADAPALDTLVTVSDRVDASGTVVEVGNGIEEGTPEAEILAHMVQAWIVGPACIRVEITEVRAGTQHQNTCVSEAAWRLGCLY